MIYSGTRPSKHAHKVKKYNHFGSIYEVPDFDFGRNLLLRDQIKDKGYYECVGYTGSHILESITGKNISPDFAYAAARYVAGDGKEGTPGTSFHAGMDALAALGGLLEEMAARTSSTDSEQWVSDWNNWTDEQKKSALKNVQNGVRNVLGNGDAFSSILSAMYQSGMPVSAGTPWFDEWRVNINNGVVQMPVLNDNYQSWHNWSIDGKKTISGIPYLIGYSWQGDRVGDGGKLYFSREVINIAMSVHGSGALIIDPNANRFAFLIGLLIRRFPAAAMQLIKLIK